VFVTHFPEDRTKVLLGLALFIFFLSALYMGLNTSFTFQFKERVGYVNYSILADAFLSGRLHLENPVDPQRLEAPDPLDPSLPYPFMDDAIIRNGKYYFQHEPFPALVRAVWLKLTGISYPTGLIIIACLVINVLWFWGILWQLRQAFFPESPMWVPMFVLAAFALSGPQLYMASRPIVHHEASAMGMCFVLGGCTFFFYGLTHVQRIASAFLLSGLFMGAAVLCRALLVIYPMVFLLCFLFSQPHKHEPRISLWMSAISYIFPIGCLSGVQLLYNYLRFGDPLDFGRRYLMYYHVPDYLYIIQQGFSFRLSHIPFQLYNYLLALPAITNKSGMLRFPIERTFSGDVMIGRELASSVFVVAPVLLLFLPILLLFSRTKKAGDLRLIITCCVLGSLAMLMALCSYVWSTARYLYDFTPLMFVVVFYNLAILWGRVQDNTPLRRLTVVGLCLLFAANCVMGLFLGFTGMIAQR